MAKSWAHKYIPVPVSALSVDADISHQSPKGYSERQLKDIVANIPEIYDRIFAGKTEKDFIALMRLSTDDKERSIGETYNKLFRFPQSSEGFKAIWDGTKIRVEAGNHRIRAAKASGIKVVPVQVYAQNEKQLQQVELECAKVIQKEGGSRYLESHHKHSRENKQYNLERSQRINENTKNIWR